MWGGGGQTWKPRHKMTKATNKAHLRNPWVGWDEYTSISEKATIRTKQICSAIVQQNEGPYGGNFGLIHDERLELSSNKISNKILS